MLQPSGETTLRSVRLRTSAGDPLLARLRAESLFSAADFHPASLPPEAILIVRHLNLPALTVSGGQVLPPAGWQAILRQRLDHFAAHAARPAFGVPANTEAILFASYAEFLAYFALDHLARRLDERWWWRSYFGELPEPARVLADAPEYIPPMLEILAHKGESARFVLSLPPEEVCRLVPAMLQKYGLPELQKIFEENAPGLDSGSIRFSASQSVPAIGFIPPGLSSPAPAPVPWAESVPEADGMLPPLALAFLGIALIIHRRLAEVRSEQFRVQVVRWLEKSRVRQGIPGSLEEHIQKNELSPESELLEATLPAPINEKLPQVSAIQQTMPFELFALPEESQTQVNFTGGLESPAEKESLQSVALPPRGVSFPRIVETQFGGLYYLLNVFLDLGFYGDFTQPEYKGLEISPWRLLELLGQEFLLEYGSDLPDLADPVFPLLEELHTRDELPDSKTVAELSNKVRRRLLKAFPELDFLQIIPLVFCEPARVTLSALRLDVTFPLERHPIEIRLAGLDRDPWWIPAAGRYVVFHYD